MRRTAPLLAFVVAGCAEQPSKLDALLAEPRPAAPAPSPPTMPPPPGTPRPEIIGTVTVDGSVLAPTACRPGRGFGTYVELATPAGKLRFESAALYWTTDVTSVMRGDKLACSRLDRSWGGGARADGSAYWRGTLAFTCSHGAMAIRGELDLDCGHITAEERAGLDRQRAQMRAQQAADRASHP